MFRTVASIAVALAVVGAWCIFGKDSPFKSSGNQNVQEMQQSRPEPSPSQSFSVPQQ